MKKTRREKQQKASQLDKHPGIQTEPNFDKTMQVARVTNNPFLGWIGRFPLPPGQNAVSWVRKFRG
jgi:hypothetical protein